MATGGFDRSRASDDADDAVSGRSNNLVSSREKNYGGQGLSRGNTEDDDAVGGRVSNFCQPCERNSKTTSATLRCLPCSERLCEECCRNHRIYTPGIHVFVDFHDTTTRRTLVDMKGFDKCAEHGNFVMYQCLDHNDVLCCEDCHFSSHKRCQNLKKISHMANLKKPNREAQNEKDMSVYINKLTTDNIVGESDETITEHGKDIDIICGQIIRAKERTIAHFDTAIARIRKEILDKNEEEKRRLDKRKTDALKVKVQLEHVQSVDNSVQLDGNYIEKYIMHLVIQNKLTQATDELKEMLKINKRVERYLDWDRQTLNVLNMKGINVTVKERETQIAFDEVKECPTRVPKVCDVLCVFVRAILSWCP